MQPLAPQEYDAWLARARRQMTTLRAPGRSDAAEIVEGLVSRLFPEGLSSPDQHVLVGEAGEVWFATGPDPVVLDLAGDPRKLLPVVHEVARAAGAAGMKILVFPREAGLAAAVADLGYATVATRMRLEPAARRPGDRPVALEPLAGDAAAELVEPLVDSYAADLLSSGTTTDPELARDTARRQTDEALAEPGSLVLAAVAGGERVGMVWLDAAADEVFVLDVVVSAGHRRRGYGRALMVATEDLARERGCGAVALSVFGDNTVARHLYDSLGYKVTETFLGIDL